MIDEHNRWLPPSPHKEAVLEQLRRGRCYIQERGHGLAPMLVFQDGGTLELPRVRAKDNGVDFWQEPGQGAATRQTKYSDICGSINELKQLMAEQPNLAEAEPDRMFRLLDDMGYMLGRLAKRREDYEAFVEAVRGVRGGGGQPDPERAPQAVLSAMISGYAQEIEEADTDLERSTIKGELVEKTSYIAEREEMPPEVFMVYVDRMLATKTWLTLPEFMTSLRNPEGINSWSTGVGQAVADRLVKTMMEHAPKSDQMEKPG